MPPFPRRTSGWSISGASVFDEDLYDPQLRSESIDTRATGLVRRTSNDAGSGRRTSDSTIQVNDDESHSVRPKLDGSKLSYREKVKQLRKKGGHIEQNVLGQPLISPTL